MVRASFLAWLYSITIVYSCLNDNELSSLQSLETNEYESYCDATYGDWSDIDMNMYANEVKRHKKTVGKSSNVYDTYNADECKRIRRPWNSISAKERRLYIDGLIELRSRGELDMNLDELVAIASAHDNSFGSITHHDSDYLFYHSYLVWELESRIRNLGGKYKCFGMPFWDPTNEYERVNPEHDEEYDPVPYIFKTGLGGYGDPDDFYRVNGYSWDISTEQYWSPMRKGAECEATGDECPICSLKRVGIAQNEETEEFKYVNSAKDVGQAIIENTKFKDFQVWVVSQCGGFPHGIDNSYDPIWYLFHSMETYYQAMWINCHNYDEIKGDELYDYIPNAFEPYCLEDDKNECVAINLDDPLYFEGVLAKRPWSFIHNEQINIKKLYHLPNWNVIYDLNDDDFYIKSRLRQKCGSNLNSEWFMFPADDIDGLIDQEMVGSFGDMSLRNKVLNIEVEYIKITCIFFVMLGFMIVLCKMYFSQRNNDEIYEISKSKYGSV